MLSIHILINVFNMKIKQYFSYAILGQKFSINVYMYEVQCYYMTAQINLKDYTPQTWYI